MYSSKKDILIGLARRSTYLDLWIELNPLNPYCKVKYFARRNYFVLIKQYSQEPRSLLAQLYWLNSSILVSGNVMPIVLLAVSLLSGDQGYFLVSETKSQDLQIRSTFYLLSYYHPGPQKIILIFCFFKKYKSEGAGLII